MLRRSTLQRHVTNDCRYRKSAFPFARRRRCLVPVPRQNSREGKQGSDKANVDIANASGNPARGQRVRRRKDPQVPGGAWSTAELKTADACCASRRDSTSPARAGAAAAVPAFTTEAGKAAQTRGDSERNSSVTDCQRLRGNRAAKNNRRFCVRSSRRINTDCVTTDDQNRCRSIANRS